MSACRPQLPRLYVSAEDQDNLKGMVSHGVGLVKQRVEQQHGGAGSLGDRYRQCQLHVLQCGN